MKILTRLIRLFSAMLLASLMMPMAQATTIVFDFSRSMEASFPSTQVATLTISDVAGGATKWTLSTHWGSQYGSAFLYFLDYDYRGSSALTPSNYSVIHGAVAVPDFGKGPAKTKAVKFQTRNGSGRFHTGESISWVFANTKAEDFGVNYVQINAINHGEGVRFAASVSVPPVSEPPKIPAGTVSRDFTDSVAGIDANQNGVRDDIEDFIGRTYTDPKQRAAMMQYAAMLQNLLNSHTRESAFVSEKQVFRALDCTREAFGKSSSKLTRDVLAMTLNTKQRALAYAQAQELSSGQVYDMFVKNPCDVQ